LIFEFLNGFLTVAALQMIEKIFNGNASAGENGRPVQLAGIYFDDFIY
jgi:hypothetical protein